MSKKIPATKVSYWLLACEIDATDEQADELTEIINQWCVRVPVAADGEPLLIGDTVYEVNTGEPRKIASYNSIEAFDEEGLLVSPSWYTHVFTDSWEKLEADAALDECRYFGKGKLVPCDDCPCTPVLGECEGNKIKDIIRRAKRLAGI